jgi:hypothetical protein
MDHWHEKVDINQKDVPPVFRVEFQPTELPASSLEERGRPVRPLRTVSLGKVVVLVITPTIRSFGPAYLSLSRPRTNPQKNQIERRSEDV